VSLSQHQTAITLNRTVARYLFVVCLLLFDRCVSAEHFRAIGLSRRGRGKIGRSLGRNNPEQVVLNFLTPYDALKNYIAWGKSSTPPEPKRRGNG